MGLPKVPEDYVSINAFLAAQVAHTELNGFSTKDIGRRVTINLTRKDTGDWQCFMVGKLLGWSASDARHTVYLEGSNPDNNWFDPTVFRAEVEIL